jgi:hypothetical protein
MSRKAAVGSVSSGTLRTDHLLRAFAWELARLDKAEEFSELIEEAARWLNTVGTDDEWQDNGLDIVEELSNALNEFAPPGHYFGAHWGDGADFGFWPLEDEGKS